MKPREVHSFRRSINEYAESQFHYGEIDSLTCDRLRSWTLTSEAREYARRLFRDKLIKVPEFNLRLQLKTLREMDGREFLHIEVVFSGSPRRRRRKCFLGHRFTPSVENTLRWNLR